MIQYVFHVKKTRMLLLPRALIAIAMQELTGTQLANPAYSVNQAFIAQIA
jgi:hypothetical protein